MTINADNPAREPAAAPAAANTEAEHDTTATEAEESEAETEDPDAEQPEGQDGEGDEDSEAEGEEGEGATGTIDVEGDDGKTYKVPAALKGHLLRQQDYTRKTQEVAVARKAVDTEREELGHRIQAAHETLPKRAEIVSIEQTLEEYKKVDWQALINSADPEDQRTLNKLKFDREQLVARHQALTGEVQKADNDFVQAQRAKFAKDREETRQQNEKNIKGWSVEADAQMVKDAGKYFGFTRDQLLPVSANHNMYRVLWDAVQYRRILEKKPPHKTVAKPSDGVQPKPAGKVAGNRTPAKAGPHDGQSTEEWMRARERQERDRRSR